MSMRGAVTVGVPIALTIGTILASIFGSYYSAQIGTNEKIHEVKEVLSEDLSETKERISTIEEAIGTIKSDNAVIKTDIKEILRAVK